VPSADKALAIAFFGARKEYCELYFCKKKRTIKLKNTTQKNIRTIDQNIQEKDTKLGRRNSFLFYFFHDSAHHTFQFRT
jgi:hypothetical protein